MNLCRLAHTRRNHFCLDIGLRTGTRQWRLYRLDSLRCPSQPGGPLVQFLWDLPHNGTLLHPNRGTARDIPQQKDAVSCGIWACIFGEICLKMASVDLPTDVDKFVTDFINQGVKSIGGHIRRNRQENASWVDEQRKDYESGPGKRPVP